MLHWHCAWSLPDLPHPSGIDPWHILITSVRSSQSHTQYPPQRIYLPSRRFLSIRIHTGDTQALAVAHKLCIRSSAMTVSNVLLYRYKIIVYYNGHLGLLHVFFYKDIAVHFYQCCHRPHLFQHWALAGQSMPRVILTVVNSPG